MDWIEVNMLWSEFEKESLNKPGTLIELEEDSHLDKKRILLIGDVNTQMGACDCCVGWYPSILIKRYKIVPWLPE